MKSTLARPELWLLAAASIGLWLWISKPKPTSEDPSSGGAPPESALTAALQLDRCLLQRDYDSARLDLEIAYRNDSPRPLLLHSPSVRLLTGKGGEVPAFILPTEPPPQIPARSTQSCRLRYWLDAAHLNDSLTLDILGQRCEVKNSRPLNLRDLDNQGTRQWTGSITAP